MQNLIDLLSWINKKRSRKILFSFIFILVAFGLINSIFLRPKTAFADTTIGLNEGYGATTYDSNGNVSGGTITGAVWRTDELCFDGRCLYFDGSGDYVTFADDADLDIAASDQVTIEGWFRTKDFTTGTKVIISKGENVGADGAWAVGLFNGSMLFSIDNDNVSSPSDYALSTQTYDDNSWHHFAAVKNGTTSISIYVDGNLVGTDTSITSGSLANDDTLLIGKDGDSLYPWDGFIDQIKIYRSLRTEAQIKADIQSVTNNRGASALFGPNPSNLSDGLIGYWRMDESSWTNNCSTQSVLDYSGNGANLTACPNTTGPTGGNIGKFGKGGTFDGSNDYLESTSTIYNLSGSATLSAWVYITGTPAGDVYVVDRSNNNAGYSLGWNSSRFPRIQIGNGTSYVTTTGSNALALNTWYHLAATVDSAGVARIYVNGRLETTGATSILATSTGQNLRIGSRSAANTITGTADEVRIYNKALTPMEIAQLASWAPPPVGYWNFDQNTGQSATDISGNSNALTLGANGSEGTDDPLWRNGKHGTALRFDGVDDFTVVTDPGTSPLDVTGGLTISAWIYKTAATGTGGWADMVVKGDVFATNVNYWFQIHEDSGAEYLDFYFVNGNGAYEIRGTQPISLNRWMYVTVVYNDLANTIQFYVDGVAQSGSNVELFGTGANTQSLLVNDENLRVGYSYSGQMFPGLLDDVKIYNYPRSASQIIEDMNGGHPAPGSPVGSAVAYWKLDDGVGTAAQDSSVNDNDLTLSTSSWTNNGKFDKAFNGLTNVRMSRADDGDLDFDAAEDVTFSLWFKSDSATNPSANEYLLEKGGNITTDAVGYAIYTSAASDGLICFGIDDDSTSFPEDSVCSTSDLYDNSWHHIVATKTGTSRLDLFVDGKPNGTPDTSMSSTGTIANAATFYIGDTNATDGTDEFLGDIDEVRIFRSALNSDQVEVLYTQSGQVVLGSRSTTSTGISSNSDERSYCPPGDTTATCSPVGEWNLDDNSGTSAKDTSQVGNSGSFSGAPVWVAGKVGQALRFDGTDDFVSVPYSASQDPTANLSVSFWFKPSVTIDSSIASNKGLLSKANTTTDANNDWVFFWNSADAGRMRFGTYGDNVQTTTATWTAGNWYHIEAVVTSTNTANIYVNGKLDTYNSDSDITTNPVNGNQDTVLNIGLSKVSTGDLYFNGLIDQVLLYDYARSASQVAWDYNRGAPSAWWRFDEGTGSSANDATGNGNTGTVTIGGGGSQTTTTQAWSNGSTGKYNGSINLDGDDYVTITESDTDGEMDFNSGDTITITAWINPTSMPASNAFATVVGKNNSGNGDGYYAQYQGNGALEFCTANTGVFDCIATTTTPVVAGSWQHVAYSVTLGTDSTLVMYHNGKALVSGASAGNIAPPLSNDPIVIGANNGVSETVIGKIDDVRIFRYALTAQQLKTVMGEGAVRFGPASGSP